MKSGSALTLVLSLWFCLPVLIDGDDGTLPLPKQSTSGVEAEQTLDTGFSLWSLLCR